MRSGYGMWKNKITVLTLKVPEDVAERWKIAAKFEGYPGVGPWLRSLSQGQVKGLGKKLPDETLTWKRGTFIVRMCGKIEEYMGEKEVKGLVAGPFGIYRGSTTDLCDYGMIYFTLVHVPSHEAFATLYRQTDCKSLARQLFRLKLSWYQTDRSKVTGPGVYEAGRILRSFLRRDNETAKSETEPV